MISIAARAIGYGLTSLSSACSEPRQMLATRSFIPRNGTSATSQKPGPQLGTTGTSRVRRAPAAVRAPLGETPRRVRAVAPVRRAGAAPARTGAPPAPAGVLREARVGAPGHPPARA